MVTVSDDTQLGPKLVANPNLSSEKINLHKKQTGRSL